MVSMLLQNGHHLWDSFGHLLERPCSVVSLGLTRLKLACELLTAMGLPWLGSLEDDWLVVGPPL